MRAYRIVLTLLALIPILTGPLDLALGLQAPRALGMALSPADLADPLLNSQIRFFGAVWFGVGLVMLVCARDLERHALVLKVIFASLVIAGMGRLAALFQFGLPRSAVGTAFVQVTTAVELILVPAMAFWLAWLARGRRLGSR